MTKTSESKDLVNMDEFLASLAKEATALEKPAGSSIGCKAGVLSYNGNPIPGNKLDAIIIASTHTNLFYEGKYDPSNISSPVCYAYSQNGEGMKPHPSSSKPQSTACDTCPQNEWGSSPNGGKGKACKNSRALALIPASTKPEEVTTAEVAVLKLPVMSVKNWTMYVQKLSALHQRPPLAMVTQIGTVPDQQSQFRVTFTDLAPLKDMGMVKGLLNKQEQALALLEREYEANEAAEAAPAKY
jgi:hypothetical protein